MKGEEKVLEFAEELTDEQLFAVNGGGWFSSSSSSSSSSRSSSSSSSSRGSGSHGGSGSHRSSGSSSSGGSAKTSSNSSKKSSSSIGSKISSAASSIGSKISSAVSSVASKVGNGASGSKQNASSTSEQKKTTGSSVYMPYQGMYTPPTRPQNSSSKSENKASGSQGQKAPSATPSGQAANTATRATNSTADNAPTGMSGCPSTYLSGNFSAGSSNAGTTKQNSSMKSSSSNWKQTSSSSSSSSNRSNSSRSSSSGSSSHHSNGTSYYSTVASTAQKIGSKVNDVAHKIFRGTEDIANKGSDTEESIDKCKPPISYELIEPEPTHGEWTEIDEKVLGENFYMNEYEENVDLNYKMNGITSVRYKIFNDFCEEENEDGYIFEIPKENSSISFVDVDEFNSFNKYGCKITSAAIIVSLATGKKVDILDINRFDKDQNGLFGSEECLDAFKNYLEEGDSISVNRYENTEKNEQFNKATFDAFTDSDDEIYVMARATTGHWIVLSGYEMRSVEYYDSDRNFVKEKGMQFNYRGSSINDRGRTYLLGNMNDDVNRIYGIDCIEIYSIKRGNKK